jgi:hypothetical protein
MLCDIEVQDTPTVVTDDEKAIERAEGDRRNREEVHRGNCFTVITEKGKPAPGWLQISRRPFHPARDRSLRDLKAEPEKLAMDAWRSPRGVLNDHSQDPFLNLLRRLSSPDGLLTLEISFQYKRNPALCQRTTVSGVTTMRDCCHPDQNRRTATQKSLSSRSNLGRGCRCFSTASC